MNNEIYKIGGVQLLDKNGFVINNFSLDNIQSKYLCVVEDILKSHLLNFKDVIDSIYLRGSVLKGVAIENVSDVDTITISKRELTIEEKEIKNKIARYLLKKYPYLNGVELLFIEKKKILESKKLQFLLKTQSKCIYGVDLCPDLPNFGLNKSSYAHSKHLSKSITKTIKKFKESKNCEDKKIICSWIMKRLVRVGFEIVMKKEKFFTRDLFFCYKSFIKYHPSKQQEMYRAVELAIYPICDEIEILKLISNLGTYLSYEIEKIK